MLGKLENVSNENNQVVRISGSRRVKVRGGVKREGPLQGKGGAAKGWLRSKLGAKTPSHAAGCDYAGKEVSKD